MNIDGSVSLTDFLIDTSDLKKRLDRFGLNNNISNALLSSKIKIIEVNFKFLLIYFYQPI